MTERMMDIRGADDIEVVFDSAADRIWVNMNSQCILRVQGIKCLRFYNGANPPGSGRVYPYVDPNPED